MPHNGLLEFLTLLVMLIGLAGCVLPIIPGPPLMWLAMLVYFVVSWSADAFSAAQAVVLAIATVIAAAGTTAEWWLSGYGARRGGASRRSTVAALLAGLAAILLLPVGGVAALAAAAILPAVVVMVMEFSRDRDRQRSFRAGCGYVTGWAFATAVELAAGLALLGLWLWQLGRVS